LAELVQGSASFGQIITRDRYSRVHLIMAGQNASDAAAILNSERLSIAVEALAHSYDHVLFDAGPIADNVLDRLASLASHAVLVAPTPDDPANSIARERLLAAGFLQVQVLIEAGGEAASAGAAAKAAA
jgi:Mrp family chromosome partitioning ATPase